MDEIENNKLLDFICPLNETVPSKNIKSMFFKSRAKWSELIKTRQNQKLYFSFNFPVFFLGLFLWAGIFGGLWFAYRGRLWFGALIWPIIATLISIATVYSLFFVIHFFVVANHITTLTWVPYAFYFSAFTTQVILSLIANYFYLAWANRQIHKSQRKNYFHNKTINVLIAFGILFLFQYLVVIHYTF